jgi:hypothetical protein
MYTPYTAHDLIRVMEQDLEARHAARAQRARLVPEAELRRPAAETSRSRFATMLLRVSRYASA